jgi:hypothetical protein
MVQRHHAKQKEQPANCHGEDLRVLCRASDTLPPVMAGRERSWTQAVGASSAGVCTPTNTRARIVPPPMAPPSGHLSPHRYQACQGSVKDLLAMMSGVRLSREFLPPFHLAGQALA